MKTQRLACLLLTAVLTVSGTDENQYLMDMSLEELLGMVVVSATRSNAKLSESPIPISVITARDIEASGLDNIPDILARLSEVDILPIGQSQTEVSIRGKGINFNRRMLVLIDGRSEYVDLFGVTLWHAFPINIEDIERIEVVRGPASALFGANAFSGVINIITRPVDSDQGTGLRVSGGDHGRNHAEAHLRHNTERWGFKITGGSTRAGSHETDVVFEGFNGLPTTMNFSPDDDSLKTTRFTAQAAFKASKDLDLKMSLGLAEADLELFPQPGLPRADWEVETSNIFLEADWRISEKTIFQMDYYVNLFEYQTPLVPPSESLFDLENSDGRFFFPSLNEPVDFANEVATNNLTLQLVTSMDALNWVAGAEARSIENSYAGNDAIGLVAEADKKIYSLFGNFTYRMGKEKWLLGMGYRYDDDELIGSDYGYTASLSFFPKAGHSIRLSSRRAFRAPSLFELHSNVLINVPNQNHSVRFEGNTELENESIESVDLTYTGNLSESLQLTVEVFRETYTSMIGNPDSGLLDDIEFDLVTQQFTTTTTFRNLADASGEGMMVQLIYLAGENLKLDLGGSYMKPDGLNDLSGETFFSSEYKVNLGAHWKISRGFDLRVENRYVSKTSEDELAEANFTRNNQQGYNLLGMNLTYAPPYLGRLNIFLNGSNLLDDDYVAYYEFDPVLNGVGERFGRGLALGVRWRFR